MRNSTLVFDAAGQCVQRYDKIHLFGFQKGEERYDESAFIEAGRQPVAVDTPFGRIALSICYDLRFPELCRRLALAGITVLFLPAEWPTARLMHWRTLTQARAIENQIFVAACNGSGAFANGMELAGHSVILDPWGERLAEAGKQPAILTADIDPAIQQKIKSTINVFADRRPELY